MMEQTACHVIYVNRAVGDDRLVHSLAADALPSDWHHTGIGDSIQTLLDAFGDVHVCSTGASCISKLFQLQDSSLGDVTPALVLIDLPHPQLASDTEAPSRPASPVSPLGVAEIHRPDEELYGLSLLQKLITEVHLRSMSKLVIPVPIISYPHSVPSEQMTDGAVEACPASLNTLATNRQLRRKCLDLGAVDVIVSPLSRHCIATLENCAYRARRDAEREQKALLEVARGRKRSWVGVHEQKPFAYLREAMVSGLMDSICRPDAEGQIASAHIAVSTERQADIVNAVGRWDFSAHSFSDDELLVASMVMFKHALSSATELERWRLTTEQLISYLVACRAAYNSFVPYHNFRHVVDVLQATFSFLIQIRTLPPFPPSSSALPPLVDRSRMATLIGPFEALTLLVTAIGHDVGHPGVNNGFLSTLNTPLAQLYNDRSVLESFHCAAYSQILRRYWPTVFEDRKMRGLMISSILATDMGLHFDYMKKLGDVEAKLGRDGRKEKLSERQQDEMKSLACSLLIKCADISNVARHHDTALQWMHILAEEFSRQASMEEALEIKSTLLAPPRRDMMSLASAQLGFMKMFAIPLFQGVAGVMPGMQSMVDELETNKDFFERKVQEEAAKQLQGEATGQFGQRQDTSRSAQAQMATTTRLADAKRCSGGGRLDCNNNNSKSKSNDYNDDDDDNNNNNSISSSNDKNKLNSIAQSGSSLPWSNGTLNDAGRAPGKMPARLMCQRANSGEGKAMNGAASAAVSPLGVSKEASDGRGFSSQTRGDLSADSKLAMPMANQRFSETTVESASGTFAGDWLSQETSATTGKAALSPSTQGTSIVSNESMERTVSAAHGQVAAASTANSHLSPGTARWRDEAEDEASLSAGSNSKAEGKTLKKRPSRFRMKDFSFFRRNKGTSQQVPAADTSS
ncbi:hypothetical protein CDD82_7537 [Ophiocordyceps australis]|uniref:Phosphodiesterase n=1 Tax=Ophiocordyceps australis TaxID=1399860 RepID=A0A2C5XER3_9HYPO|nr:hypothetical protein CDD82_7537 [Ophiocordyceps australis]